MEILSSKTLIARKAHICNYCGETIHMNEAYERSSVVSDDSFYEWKAHKKCSYLAHYLWHYIDPLDGMTSEEFCNGCIQFCNEFVCETCNKCSSCNRNKLCIDRLYIFCLCNRLEYARHDYFKLWKCQPLSVMEAYLNKLRVEGKLKDEK